MNLNGIVEKTKDLIASHTGIEPVIGLDFNHSQVFAIELGLKKGKTFVNHFASATANFKPENMDHALTKLFEKEKFSSSKVSIALSGSVVLVRFIEYPKMNLEELRSSMKFQIEQYIPFQVDDVITDFHILGESKTDPRKMRVILVAAKKTEVMNIVETLQRAKLTVQVVDIHAFACLTAFSFSQPAHQKEGACILLDIGQQTSSLLVLEKGEPAFIREIAIGNQEILEIFKKKAAATDAKAGSAPLADDIRKLPAAFTEACDPLFTQIRLSVNYFMSHHPGIASPKAIYLSGDLCGIPEFGSSFKNALGMDARVWDCLEGVDLGNFAGAAENVRSILPLGMGLAMRREE